MEYKTNDLVLPIINLPNPCPIKIIIDDKYVKLYVGQRDWQWLLDGNLMGAGTIICEDKEVTMGS